MSEAPALKFAPRPEALVKAHNVLLGANDDGFSSEGDHAVHTASRLQKAKNLMSDSSLFGQIFLFLTSRAPGSFLWKASPHAAQQTSE